ncbi:putative elongator complex protein 1 [Sycon ciliatum]|uniref:putative elongator complex protein 1 n=1 Tax=Sycon ciliatum TaxID=27933 RepID=UPI0031F662BB
MRNLELLRPVVHRAASALENVRCLCVNLDVGHVYCVSDEKIFILRPETGEVLAEIDFTGIVAPVGSESPRNTVVGCHYLSELRQLVVALTGGDVVSVETMMCDADGLPDSKCLDCVGCIDAGIVAMAWSPDEEVGAFLTADGKLVLMTKEFDSLAEVVVEVSEFGASAFVNVGWGKKETQFHGSEGKQAAKAEKKPVLPVRPWDDRTARVSWRGDGQCVAVSAISAESGGRKVRVFSREGVLLSTSENVDGLEQALSWKPSGSLITSSQRLPHRHDIVFFEKNGLRHGEFTLPFQRLEVRVCEVSWNIDSSVLAVWCESLPDGVDEKSGELIKRSPHIQPPAMSYVQLWTFSNYHYYMKQQLCWKNTGLQCVHWDSDAALRLHVMASNGEYGRYDWFWTTSVSPGLVAENNVTVSVTDGGKLLQTPLRRVVVPPPMSHRSIALNSPAAQCAVSPPAQSVPTRYAVLLSNGCVGFYSEQQLAPIEQRSKDKCGFRVDDVPPTHLGDASIPHLLEDSHWHGHCVRQLTWLDAHTVLVAAWDVDTVEDYLLCLRVDSCNGSDDGGARVKLVMKSSLAMEKPIYRVTSNPDRRLAVVQLNDGTVWKVLVGGDGGDDGLALEAWPATTPGGVDTAPPLTLSPYGYGSDNNIDVPSGLQLSVPCSSFGLCVMGDEDVVLALTDHYRLFVNGFELSTNCTSFAVHDEYLLLTTHSHTCRCISLTTPVSELTVLKDADRNQLDDSIRRVERGSRIVAVVPFDTKLVLQMPRGNLETIHPRALVLSAVRRHLKNLQYTSALDIMRRHRINMNLIHDYESELFLANAQRFVEQINDVSRINLFLSDLRDEDVTVSMYSSCSSRDVVASSGQTSAVVEGKTARVGDHLRGAMIAVDEKKFLHSILMTHIKRPTPDLESVLAHIKRLRDSSVLTPSAVTDAIKFVLYSVDVNQLYDVALGMYDLDLVMMVAEKSQKDPKEYVPFLNSLRHMSSFDKYTIDMYLRRHSRALSNISECEDKFETAFELIIAHKLHRQALCLYSASSDNAKRIAESYGQYLAEAKQYAEAALVLCKYNLHSLALPCLEKAINWRQAMAIARKLQYDSAATMQLACSLADALVAQRRHGEAVQVLVDYTDKYDEAIGIALDGHLWEEAYRLMYRFEQEAQVEEELRPCLVQACHVQVGALDTHIATFSTRVSRLAVVREDKIKARQERLDMGLPADGPDADLYSDASSLASRTTASSAGSNRSRQTARTAKNRRKAERKKHRLREGSAHEEEALIESLAEIITTVDGLRSDVGCMLRVLYLLNEELEAVKLQSTFAEVMKLICDKLRDVWRPVAAPGAADSPVAQVPSLGPNATAADFVQQHLQKSSSDSLPVVGVPAPAFSADRTSWRLTILDS